MGRGKWRPFDGVRRPLRVRVLVIESPVSETTERIAIVSLELLGLADEVVGGFDRFADRVLSASAVGGTLDVNRVVFTSTHTHSGPDTLAISDLYRRDSFRPWIDLLVERI